MNSINIPKVDSLINTVNKIKNKEISVLDLINEHLEQAKYVQENTNAFITILEDEAREQARILDEKIKNNEIDINNSKLLGIPFTVKDLYLVKNTKTTFASKYMEDFVAPYTATVVQKCLDQGAILIGKTNCDPWGFGGSGENSGFGVTKHPLDLTRSPGGSSSGSAASLLGGVGFFSLGTDTGGSVRLPASFCGLYGLKPTYGRNSRYGIGAMGSSFDTPGFFTRNVEDMALLQEIMAGKDINDATTDDISVPNYLQELENIDKNLTIGLPEEFFEDLNQEMKGLIDAQIQKLREKGFKIKNVSIPSTRFGLAVYYILVPSEISSNRARYDGVRFGKKVSEDYEENMIQGRSEYFEKEVKRRIMIGTYALSKGYSDQFYKQASKVRTKLKKEFEKVFEEVDILISPVSPTSAFKLGEKNNDPVEMYLVDIYTVTANIVGIPSLSIPIGTDSQNLPVGMQLMSKKWNESDIFKTSNILAAK